MMVTDDCLTLGKQEPNSASVSELSGSASDIDTSRSSMLSVCYAMLLPQSRCNSTQCSCAGAERAQGGDPGAVQAAGADAGRHRLS